MKTNAVVIVPNWNGADFLSKCLKSLQGQSLKTDIIVVDNGSKDDSIRIVEKEFPDVRLIKNPENLGFAGGVNAGIKKALGLGYDYIALFNNDAVADKNWTKLLAQELRSNAEVGAAAGKLLKLDGKSIDSTGDYYSIWGLSMARQRSESSEKAIDKVQKVFGATAGACMYKREAVQDIGLFDEKFFAYYEDTDYNFRLQLRGWKILYVPGATAYHAIGGTSGKLSGFTTHQTLKNLPMLFWKNVPARLLPRLLPRFCVSYSAIFFSSLINFRAAPAIKGVLVFVKNIPYVAVKRRDIQKNRNVNSDYIYSILYKDLPPDAYKLRRLRRFFTGKA